MNKRLKTLGLVTVLGAAFGSAGAAVGQGPIAVGGTMNVEPSTVEPGDSYVISNDADSPCFGEVSGDTGGVRPGAWFADPDVDGNWSVTIEVPENGPPDATGNPTPFPAGDYEQHAFCDQATPTGAAAPAQQAEFDYEPVDVTVVAPVEEPTPEPPAAEPAAEAPTFTG